MFMPCPKSMCSGRLEIILTFPDMGSLIIARLLPRSFSPPNISTSSFVKGQLIGPNKLNLNLLANVFHSLVYVL